MRVADFRKDAIERNYRLRVYNIYAIYIFLIVIISTLTGTHDSEIIFVMYMRYVTLTCDYSTIFRNTGYTKVK